MKLLQKAPSIAVVQEKDGRFYCSAHEYFGLGHYMSLVEMQEIYDRYKLDFWICWRQGENEHSATLSRINDKDLRELNRRIEKVK